MKITLLRAAAQGCDYGLSGLTETVSGVLTELGLAIDTIDLENAQIPFFRGESLNAGQIPGIIANVRGSSGVIFAASAPMRAVCAPALRFLEYMSLPECAAAFEGKNCMLLTAAPKNFGGEREALEYLSRVLTAVGAFDSVRIGLREGPEFDGGVRSIVEKQAEDFYRLVRQNRKFIVPNPVNSFNDDAPFKLSVPKPKTSLSEIYKKLNIPENDARQDEDVREIAKFFTDKFNGSGSGEKPPARPAQPRAASCRRMTRDLPRRFRPQASQGVSAVISVSVSGAEVFEGWFDIRDTECAYHDGVPPCDTDMAILADTAVWSDVLKGKCSAQKAFMIGMLKVRGNFVLLQRFDQMFETEAAAERHDDSYTP